MKIIYLGDVSDFFLHAYNPSSVRHSVQYIIGSYWKGKLKKCLKVLGGFAAKL